MADKGWTARVSTAAGVAAGTGAAQLGLGYGLGVVTWPTVETADDSVWLGSLSWATWIVASSTVLGAVVAARLGGGPALRSRGPWRMAIAASAGVGALVAVALIALPARSAVRVDAHSPQVIATGYALVGLVAGLFVAYWAVLSRSVAANLLSTAAWLWAMAVGSVVAEFTVHRKVTPFLTSWQFATSNPEQRFGAIFWPSAVLTMAAAFLIGMLSVVPATRRRDLGTGAATSGAVGPLLVAVAFLALAPRLSTAVGPLESAYLIAPYAVLAGLAGSALTVAITKAGLNRIDRRAQRLALPAIASGVATVPPAPRQAPAPPAAPKAQQAAAPKPQSAVSTQQRAAVAPQQPDLVPPPAEPKPKSGLFGRREEPVPPPPAIETTEPRPKSGLFGRRRETPAEPEPVIEQPAEPKPKSGLFGRRRETPAEPEPVVEQLPEPKPKSGLFGRRRDKEAEAGATPAIETAAAQSEPAKTTPAKNAPTQTAPTQASSAQASSAQASSAQAPSKSTPAKSAPIKATPAKVTPAKAPSAPAKAVSAKVTDAPAAPQPLPDEALVDPELAAAARPKPRPRKPAAKSTPDKAPKSTITPPPSNPTVAQINPKNPK